jgi:uncharacterized DUF497 family protein
MGACSVPLSIDELFWSDNNVDHLWQSHGVTADEVEEIIFGIEGAPPDYRARRIGAAYIIYGETGAARLLKMAGEFMSARMFRVFGAIDMDNAERRSYRKGKI